MKTSKSLIIRAKEDPTSEAWYKINAIYDPLIAGWLRRSGIGAADLSDITQEVLLALVTNIDNFQHNGRQGAFRNWLRTIAVNRCHRYWRKKKRNVPLEENQTIESFLEQLADPNSELAEAWDREHDEHVLRKILQLIYAEFDSTTMAAFKLSAIEGLPAKQIASQLKLSTSQVYKCKFRVMKRLHEEAEGLIDEDDPQLDETQTQSSPPPSIRIYQ